MSEEQIGKGVRVDSGENARVYISREDGSLVKVVLRLHYGTRNQRGSIAFSGSTEVARRIAKLLLDAADEAYFRL